MRAILLKRAGSPDRFVLIDMPKPTPSTDEILVRIRATSVTRGDVVLRKMPRLVTRLVGERPKSILGHEFAGDVEATGESVSRLAVGDRVFGTTTGLRQGSYAQYIAVPADGMVAGIPADVGYEDAAPVPVGAMAALHFLREGGLEIGKKVLINGASGSVGTFGVQIAKHLGAHVTGVCGPSNTQLVEALGADEVIDYTTKDFTKADQTYDVIFDAVGKTSAKQVEGVLTGDGVFVTTSKRKQEKVDDLFAVRDLLEAGVVKAVIDRRYALEEIPEAHRYVEQGHKRGNVVVRVDGGDLIS